MTPHSKDAWISSCKANQRWTFAIIDLKKSDQHNGDSRLCVSYTAPGEEDSILISPDWVPEDSISVELSHEESDDFFRSILECLGYETDRELGGRWSPHTVMRPGKKRGRASGLLLLRVKRMHRGVNILFYQGMAPTITHIRQDLSASDARSMVAWLAARLEWELSDARPKKPKPKGKR